MRDMLEWHAKAAPLGQAAAEMELYVGRSGILFASLMKAVRIGPNHQVCPISGSGRQ